MVAVLLPAHLPDRRFGLPTVEDDAERGDDGSGAIRTVPAVDQQRLRFVAENLERPGEMRLGHASGIARHRKLPEFQAADLPPVGVKVPQIENGSKAAPLQLQELLPVRLGAAEDTVFRIDLVKVARQVALSRRRRHRHHRRTGEKEQPSAPSVHIPSPPCSRSRNDCGETPQNRRKLREK